MKRLIKKQAGWLQLDRDRTMASGDEWGTGDNSKETWYQEGILSLDTLNNAVGFSGENRQWTTDPDGEPRFGNYSKARWDKFLEDIQTNGVQNPIVLEVWTDGTIKIWEGNHRVEACRQLGINQIPAKVYYKGRSERQFKIQLG